MPKYIWAGELRRQDPDTYENQDNVTLVKLEKLFTVRIGMVDLHRITEQECDEIARAKAQEFASDLCKKYGVMSVNHSLYKLGKIFRHRL